MIEIRIGNITSPQNVAVSLKLKLFTGVECLVGMAGKIECE